MDTINATSAGSQTSVENQNTNRLIIPIAGGKGGVGKSMTAANLAIALAQLGHETVVIDLDLGSSNLHFMLGLQNTYPGIGDYLRSDDESGFNELQVQTEWPKLKYIPGEGRMPFIANITYSQKIRLIKHIREIKADFIILDLSAGASYNVLDFFSMVDSGLVVTTPDRISVINMLSFLKQSLLRVINRTFVKNNDINDIVNQLVERPITDKQIPISALIDRVSRIDNKAAGKISRICADFRPRIVYNMARAENDLKMVHKINNSVHKILSIKVTHVGTIVYDPIINTAIATGESLLKTNADCPASQCIYTLAGRIAHQWADDKMVDNQTFIQESLALFRQK